MRIYINNSISVVVIAILSCDQHAYENEAQMNQHFRLVSFNCTCGSTDVVDTKTCYMICQRCIRYLACLADSNSGIQAGILRLLLESAFSKVSLFC